MSRSAPLRDPYRAQPEEAAGVLSRALVRAAEQLALPRAGLARLLGVSEASLSRLAHGRRTVDPESKEGELALLFLRLYRSLDALVGGDEEKARAWMHAENAHLSAIPAQLVQDVTGLVHALDYLDAMRGKL